MLHNATKKVGILMRNSVLRNEKAPILSPFDYCTDPV